MYAKFLKYEFWLIEVVFLVHVIFGNDIFMDPRKVEANCQLGATKEHH